MLDTLSRKYDTEAAIHALKLWSSLLRYYEDGVIEIDSSATERALRGVAIGRHNSLFASADNGGERADHPVSRVDDFSPWNCSLPATL